MAYSIKDICVEFGTNGKPASRSTIYRWLERKLITPPDIWNGAHPRWLTMPIKANNNQEGATR